MSTDRLWTVLAPSGPDVQEDHRLRVMLREAGLEVTDEFTCRANAGVLVPAAGKMAWLYAGLLLGRGGELVVLGRDGRARKIEDLGGKTCLGLDDFLLRCRDGMV